MKRLLLASISFFFVLLVSVQGLTEEPKRGGTLTVAIKKDISRMNPLVKTSSMDKRVRTLMFEPLLGLDLKGNIQPNLAESWEVSNNGKLYTFKIRKGVKFHNGQIMTAEDVKFSMDYTMNPKNGAFGFTRLSLVDRVEVADEYSLKIYLKEVSPAFLYTLTEIKAFSVVPKGSLEEGLAKPKTFPVGTGPFRFVEWKPKQRLVLERFEDYWGQKSFVDKVVLRPIRDTTVKMTALRAGDVDLAEGIPLEGAKQIMDGEIKGLGFAMATYGGFSALRFNITAPPFNNVKMRKAVAYAIDRKEILNAAFFGFGEPSDQNYPKGSAWYFNDVSWPKQDLEKARALLKEAGYNGETLPILTLAERNEQTMGTTLQAQLKRIGMSTKLDVMEYGAFVSRERAGKFVFGFAGGGSPKPDPFATFGPQLMCGDLKKRKSNTSGYCDQEMDELLRKGAIEIDSAKRKMIFKKIATKLSQDMPYIVIGFDPDFFAFRGNIKGFVTEPDGNLQWWGGGISTTWIDK